MSAAAIADTAERYRVFAERDTASSPIYSALAAGIAEDPVLLALIAGLPDLKRQPNLVFAAARLRGAPVGDAAVTRAWLREHFEEIRPEILARSTQTNEIARSAVLLPALAAIPGPIALLEAGTSAGLCLRPDRLGYRYDEGGTLVELAPSKEPPLRLDCRIAGGRAPERLPEVVWRAGVDLHPLDAGDPDDRAWLELLIWPEHEARRERLRAALDLARAEPAEIVAGDLLERIPELIDRAPAGATVVVFHTAVLVYLSPEDRERFAAIMRARPEVVWLSNEGPEVLPWIGPGLLARDDGRFILARDEEPFALTDPHGASLHLL